MKVSKTGVRVMAAILAGLMIIGAVVGSLMYILASV